MPGVITEITTINGGAIDALSAVDVGTDTSKAFGVNAGGDLGFYDSTTLGSGGASGTDPLGTTITNGRVTSISAIVGVTGTFP